MKQGELYYTGTITEIIDPLLYVIKADIPGNKSGITAFPMRGEVDEPRVGDFILLRCFDPVFQSYYLYSRIKENDFIGFRSRGKMVDITPDYIQVAIFDPDNDEWNDVSENGTTDDEGRVCGGYRPKVTDWFKLDKDGNLSVHLRSNSKVVIEGAQDILVNNENTEQYNDNVSITVDGDLDLKVRGTTTVQSQFINIKGPGQLTCKGTVVPSATGPFVATPVTPMAGSPFPQGDTIILS